MTKVYYLTGILGLLLLTSCNVQVSSDTGATDLPPYKTFNWAEQAKKPSQKFKRAGKGERIVELNINTSLVEKELLNKGFTADTSKPDFLIRCKAFYEKEDNSNNLDWTKPGNATRSPGWGGNIQNSSGLDMVPEKTTVTIVELLDPLNEEVMWRGVKSTVVGETLNLSGILEKDISLIIKKIPVKKSSKVRKQ